MRKIFCQRDSPEEGKTFPTTRWRGGTPSDGGELYKQNEIYQTKDLGARGLIKESFPAQQLYEFVHSISIDVKVEAKGKFEILFAAFQNGFPN